MGTGRAGWGERQTETERSRETDGRNRWRNGPGTRDTDFLVLLSLRKIPDKTWNQHIQKIQKKKL